MAALHLFATNAVGPRRPSGCFVGSRSGADALAHLPGMDTKTREQDVTDRPQLTLIEQVLSLSELCAHVQVSAQTIQDLRSQGRGPRGFRVGRDRHLRRGQHPPPR